MKTIAIVGGGFSGTMAAVNLARYGEGPLRVVIVNHRFPLGRGIAYSTARPEHLLNVAARNMSALADQPNHFLQWLRTRSEYAEVPEAVLRETFVPRRVYGDYLRSLLLWHTHPINGAAHVQVETLSGEVVDIEPGDSGGTLVLADGTRLEAHRILLAMGNQLPAGFASLAGGCDHRAYVAAPWMDWSDRLPPPGSHVVLLGTGLTMVDAFLTLAALGWQGTIDAVSRNGLLPLSHFRGIEYSEFPPADPSVLGLDALAELVAEHCRILRGRGENPAIVVDRLRPHTQRIWQHFSLAEKREFCRTHRARWNVTRHRIAQQIHQQMVAALAAQTLRVVPGAVRAIEGAGERVRVHYDGPAGQPGSIEASLVINCTGPQESLAASQSELVANLFRRGLCRADPMQMGVDAAADFAVVDAEGSRSRFLFAIGPLLKGVLWESVAVPELRGQSLRVAQTLLEECMALERSERWPVAVEAPVLEYWI